MLKSHGISHNPQSYCNPSAISKSHRNRRTVGPEYIEPGASPRPVRSPIAVRFQERTGNCLRRAIRQQSRQRPTDRRLFEQKSRTHPCRHRVRLDHANPTISSSLDHATTQSCQFICNPKSWCNFHAILQSPRNRRTNGPEYIEPEQGIPGQRGRVLD